ncbi:nucleosome assembly protein 1;2-like isoform X2 [Solanum dulcamara]|uniref:nucleosome assembly protein 1;2-like isoform X2 n=1 Tax=Solanum dulcamara TaxID=45834 RepID=UPI002486B50E|nr:nucleosome assembly protein 1;2-like isoform X2 [Solanum dulcamara]
MYLKLNMRSCMIVVLEEKGVPNFWLTALKSCAKYEEEIYISKRDEEALKFLKDIKWCRVDHPKGFKLDFFFDTNPFFKNSVLTKTCHKRVNMAMAENVTWTDIEWFPGKCLTKKIVKCNPNKRLISAKPMIRTVDCESFFSFFKPPSVTELQYHMQEDYEIESVDHFFFAWMLNNSEQNNPPSSVVIYW